MMSGMSLFLVRILALILRFLLSRGCIMLWMQNVHLRLKNLFVNGDFILVNLFLKSFNLFFKRVKRSFSLFDFFANFFSGGSLNFIGRNGLATAIEEA